MVISTMHEKSCRYLHNAHQFENVPNFNPSHISNLRDKITTLSMTQISLNHWTHTTQLFNKSFFPELDRFVYELKMILLKLTMHILQNLLTKYIFPCTHISVHILWRFSIIIIIVSSKIRCCARDPQTRHIFIQCTVRHRPLRNFAYKFRLCKLN